METQELLLPEKTTRPMLRYHGGKWILAKWIINLFPKHKIYTETFGGAASVLLQKPRSYAEIYNDLDGDIVNLFKVARDNGNELKRLLELTPFSRAEFDLSYENSDDQIEQARRTVVKSFMGFSSGMQRYKTGFRSNSNRSGSTPSHDWSNYPAALEKIINRLQGVVIENKDSREVMLQQDSDQTLHYVDPPYVLDTRYMGQKTKIYAHELSNDDHIELCHFLKGLRGYVVLSGYQNEIYDGILDTWTKIERKAFADGAKERTEVLWLNYNPENNLNQVKLIL